MRRAHPVLTGLLVTAVAWAGLAAGGAIAAPDPDQQTGDELVDDETDDGLDEGTDEQQEGEVGTVTSGGDAPPATLPLIPLPTGCDAPTMPHVVFVGRVVDRDYRTVRYEVERVRSGRTEPFASGDRIDVRYGLDAQYLDDGERYLVSAVADPDLGFLVSRVTPPIEHFGGDEVIGVSETDVDCPEIDDPMRTLHLDGSAIDAGVLDPMIGARTRIVGALLIPVAVAAGVIFLLAMFRLSLAGLFRSLTSQRGP